MTYGLWLSTAGLQVNEYRQDVMANNLANADTTGFKHDLAVIHERMVESRSGAGNRAFAHPLLDRLTGGVWVKPTVYTFEQGALESTDRPLDVAIYGEGFFTVRDGDQTRFTRDGRFTLNRDGELVMVAGRGRFRVLSDVGEPILLDTGHPGGITISSDGTIGQGAGQIAKLGVVDFADRSQLSKAGENVYRNHGAPGTPSSSEVRSGYLERSTADPIRGLAAMIEVSRAYQLNANLISLQDQTIGQAVGRVGRIG